jgi:hypothetical protein
MSPGSRDRPGRDLLPRRAYRGRVKGTEHQHHDRPQVITEARWPMSADIRYRQRRYLIMMGIRLVCFVAAVVVFVNHGGWLAAIPAVGAIAIPYFAVVFANGGREPAGRRQSFQGYDPNLPERYVPPANGQSPNGSASSAGQAGSGAAGTGPAPSSGPDNAGADGAEPHSG